MLNEVWPTLIITDYGSKVSGMPLIALQRHIDMCKSFKNITIDGNIIHKNV